MNGPRAYEQVRSFLKSKDGDLFFENPLIGITVVDRSGRILRLNQSQLRITGMNISTWLNKSVYDLESEGIMVNSGSLKVLRSKRQQVVRQSLINGKSFFVQSFPVKDHSGELSYVLNYLVDTSELSLLKEKLDHVRNETDTLDSLPTVIFQEQRLIYSSKAVQSLVETMELVADSDATVLITGASGVGKEMIARELHEKSRRRNKPFVKISCEAIPASLLESELFGYERGAFTGASEKGKKGLFEEANGGTVFLDEIGEMPPELQVKLLQVLQEHAVRRVGGSRKLPVDMRIIAATNADLEQMLKERRFRGDLYYRLNVIALHVPDLEERSEDIPLLAQHFLDMFNVKYGKNKSLSLEAASYLAALKYEGNVRQLRNLLERLVLLTRQSNISANDIRSVYAPFAAGKTPLSKTIENLSLKASLEDREKEILLDLWQQHRNASVMARVLSVSPATLSRKLRKHNILRGVDGH